MLCLPQAKRQESTHITLSSVGHSWIVSCTASASARLLSFQDIVDSHVNETDPEAIHLMLVIGGAGPFRLFSYFIRSLVINHFEGHPNAAPVHLHINGDEAARVMVETLLESWRISGLRYTMYQHEVGFH